ncbi:MAG: hypothetical protein BGO82_02410 [Devosia sp. 67-54]|uniref:hypothetical protein n=1 Tax=unclassified Devosia TaxID=196773 RepID=UPI0009634505|nr:MULTISPECIES: hypothetical protein [unclassified Devosia]MBN9305319.1 hypothetical protein [Devosia sp.]OJX18920.1 MAG: hypothetical protein BGO82_02410 [Devosia sp. 67-54]
MRPASLLIISNGIGEDSVGAELARRLPSSIKASAYPTLGSGAHYDGVCEIVGPRATLASAGSRVAQGTIARDVRGGLLGTVPPGLAFMHRARRAYDRVLVIGDFIGVGGCFLTGIRNVTYIDVYKSGYGRPYLGIERWVIGRTCRTVFSRHPALADRLRRDGVDARAVGNVMMDTIPRSGFDAASLRTRPLAATLLPGSREATAENFALQVAALRRLPETLRPDVFLALAGGVAPEALAAAAGLAWTGLGFAGDLTIHAARGALGDLLDNSDVVLSQAGTATIQALGLGRPIVSFIRPGDRMRRHEDESRLFGESRLLVADDATEIASALTLLLQNEPERLRRGAIGQDRIGPPGALDRIIETLLS